MQFITNLCTPFKYTFHALFKRELANIFVMDERDFRSSQISLKFCIIARLSINFI